MGQNRGEEGRSACVGGYCVPEAELGTSYMASSHPPAVLLRESFVYLWSISLSLLQSAGVLVTGHRGLYLLEVRTVSGPEMGKKGRKARRGVAKMDGEREGGRGQGKDTLS